MSKELEMFIIRTFVFIIRTHREAGWLYNIFIVSTSGKSETQASVSTNGNRYLLNVAHEATKKHRTICKIWIAS